MGQILLHLFHRRILQQYLFIFIKQIKGWHSFQVIQFPVQNSQLLIITIYPPGGNHVPMILPHLILIIRPASQKTDMRKKKRKNSKREELYDIIMEQAVATGLGTIGPDRIDEINILQATYEAMREAISKLDPQPDLLLNDAVTIAHVAIHLVPII